MGSEMEPLGSNKTYLTTALVPQWGAPDKKTAPIFTLIGGQADVEPWADEQEITVDRIVGQLHVVVEHAYDSLLNVFGNDIYVKAGLIVNEEITQDVDEVKLDLFEQETMEDYEWMWLGNCVPLVQNGSRQQDSYIYTRSHFVWNWDIRNRRKVGQSDELNLFMQYLPFNTVGEDDAFAVSAWVDCRQIMLSK